MTKNDSEGPIERGKTILRPKPRGERPRAEMPPPPPFPPPRSGAEAARRPPAGLPGAITTYNLAGSGLNPLVRAAAPLLLIAGRLRRTAAPIDCTILRTRLAAEVNTFDQRLLRSGVPAEQAEAASCALCATIDEAVLSTHWGASGDWGVRPLLLMIHGQSTGGEKFFEWVERMVSDPRLYFGLLEVYYQSLSLGYEGRPGFQPQNSLAPLDIRKRLFGHLRMLRGETPRPLSRHWRGTAHQRARGFAALQSWIQAVTLSHKQRKSVSRESSITADLEHRYSNIVGRLTKNRTDGRRIRSLPWWLVFGMPESGNTTLIARSELPFVAVPAPDETRGCNWWFTDDAVLLDISGKVDWNELQPFFKLHRHRIQGALVTHSASNLLTRTAMDRDALFHESRERLLELNGTLGRSLPIYLLITKMDVILGFREYFADLDTTDRNQVWGVTFALADSRSGRAVNTLPAEFDALVGRLHDGLAQRLRDETELRERSILFEFPQQMAALKPSLIELVNKTDQISVAGLRSFLRGVYFTSGGGSTTFVDAVACSVDAPPFSADAMSARTFFIRQLLRDVVLREAGLSL